MINGMYDKVIKDEILLTNHVEYEFSNNRVSKGTRSRKVEFKYAGLSKHSPSHAQQKRDSKKAKNKGRGYHD
jgi:hypothetical protein